ncbi:MAG: molybdopterin-dependent oxidoreductase [Actinomycetota bacterium]
MRKKIIYNTIIILVIAGLVVFLGYFIVDNELQKRREDVQVFVPEDIDIDQIEDDFEFAETIPQYNMMFAGQVAESEITFTQLLQKYSHLTETRTVRGIRSDGEQVEVEYTGIRLANVLEDLAIEEEAAYVIVYATDLYAADFTLDELKDSYLVWKKEGQYMNPTQDGVIKIVQDDGLTSKWIKNPVFFSFTAVFKDMVSEADRIDAEWLEFASEQSMFTLSIGMVPQIDQNDWQLVIEGLVDNPITLDYEELRGMEQESVYATLETISNPPGGQLIGNAVWTGVPFIQLMDLVQYREEALEAVFYCQDGYSTSITVEEAKQPGVMLAYQMNGRALADEHGFPARMVIPSKYGMKWAKWINRIEFVDYDYKGYWESRGWSDYAGRDRPDVRFD